MASVCLKLGPVYSRLAGDDDLEALRAAGFDLAARLPPAISLRRHQALTWLAYADRDVDVIFDLALTGDGKSLAGQLPMLAHRRSPLLLYPTNELLHDQQRQVENYIAMFGASGQVKPVELYGERIVELMAKTGFEKRASQVLAELNRSSYKCFLSNPDLFHLFGSYGYGGFKDRQELVYALRSEFDYYVFDEFHIFGPPQVISVLNILNYQQVAGRQRKYIFLSATPGRLFKTLLQNSGFRLREIEGEYSARPAPGFTPQPIVQPVSLNLESLSDTGAYGWAVAHLEELKTFYAANPGSKGVFIVNSVATAKRLAKYYREQLGAERVAENTGLTGREERRRAFQDPRVRLIIATSTVDVGVDFSINLLIFESYNAGSFIQRLGRLGRHPNFSEYRAYALLPAWQVERIGECFKAFTGAGAEPLDRLEFLEALREPAGEAAPIFQPDQEYRAYARRWGGLQSAHLLYQDRHTGHNWKGEFREKLFDRYCRAYGASKGWLYAQLKRYEELLADNDRKLILDELAAFRGTSRLACGIYDVSDPTRGGEFKTYDLFFLLANTEFEPMAESEFRRLAGDRFEQYRSRELNLYVRLKAYREERDNFRLTSCYSLKNKCNQVTVLDGFRVEDSKTLKNHLDRSVNERLEELKLVCLPLKDEPKKFKRRKGLNPLFPVYTVWSDEDNTDYGIVFDLEALLAESLVFWQDGSKDDPLLLF